MKLLFSEYKSDYANYIFPYAIWAIPEANETPATVFAHGFLPSSRNFERFYMCRQIRVALREFSPSSENRRILRKCEDVQYELLPVERFNYNRRWRDFCKTYADIKFGKNKMPYERLDSLFESKIVSHVLIFRDGVAKKEVGLATLYLEEPVLAYYYYAFYDLNYYSKNLGMFMMTSAVDYFANEGYHHIYLGTCYSRNALYKTQFRGAEFFNGFCWSQNLKELKYLIGRDKTAITKHLVETEEYREKFYDSALQNVVKASHFTIPFE